MEARTESIIMYKGLSLWAMNIFWIVVSYGYNWEPVEYQPKNSWSGNTSETKNKWVHKHTRKFLCFVDYSHWLSFVFKNSSSIITFSSELHSEPSGGGTVSNSKEFNNSICFPCWCPSNAPTTLLETPLLVTFALVAWSEILIITRGCNKTEEFDTPAVSLILRSEIMN